jgi:hypothetical protein
LWRVRRRHDHIDAVLRVLETEWELEYRRNDRPMIAWRFEARADVDAEARSRLQALQRAGWTTHW